MARPLNDFSRSLLRLVARRPLTSREIAEQLQVSLRQAVKACSNLKGAGHVIAVETLRTADCRRPMYRYALNKELSM